MTSRVLKLGIHVAKHTIQRHMHKSRLPQEPSQNWSSFLHNHATHIWACDFLPVLDLTFRNVFLFFIIELSSRRVVHFGITRHPTAEWVAQQLREATPNGGHPKFILRDHDAKFGTAFDRVATSTGIEVLKIPYQVQRANAMCERFLGSVRRECWDHMLILSERQLFRVVRDYVAYFYRARPHRGLKQQIPEAIQSGNTVPATNKIIPLPSLKKNDQEQFRETSRVPEAMRSETKGMIIAFSVLNGLHHDYRRVA